MVLLGSAVQQLLVCLRQVCCTWLQVLRYSAAETAGRKEIADETGNPIDRVQQYISGASLAADAASYAPPLTVPATIVSTGLDAINVGIDTTRGFINLFTRR